MAGTLYALVVGINDYPHVRPLKGCVNDARSIKAYLDEKISGKKDIKIMLGQETEDDQTPTKARLVEAFQTHLGQAESGDIALFYFAGHGVQEQTNIPAFEKAEVAGLLESVVCYDSKPNEPGSVDNTCLADKELRYLISNLSEGGAHVVTIFDCCHSGDNTREAFDAPRLAREKAISERGWEGFIFHNEISLADLKEKPLPEIIPQGAHVQMAACRDVELAKESKRPDDKDPGGKVWGGNFTYSLLEFLNHAGGDISYYDLRTRLTNYMRGQKRAQTPQIYVHPPTSRSIYFGFLDGAAVEREVTRIAMYNRSEQGLILNIGAFHGLESTDIGKEVHLFAQGDRENAILAKIRKILPDRCILGLVEPGNLQHGEMFDAVLKANISRPVSVFAAGDSSEIALFKDLFAGEGEEKDRYIKLENQEDLADYVVRSQEGAFLITNPGDDKPLVEQVTFQNEAGAKLVKRYLGQIARWELIRKLKNPNTKLNKRGSPTFPMYPVELRMIRLLEDDTEEIVTLSKPTIEIPLLYENDEGKLSTKIKLELINHSDRSLYVSLVYLPMTFGSYPTLLPGGGIWLEPGDSIRAAEDEFIELTHDSYVPHFNWPDTREFVKMLISTVDFDTEALFLEELPPPQIPGSDGYRGSFRIPKVKREVQQDDWMDYTVEFRILNMEYSFDS